jgi:hypothetical protein
VFLVDAKRIAVVAVAIAASMFVVTTARADGDPASDYLLVQKVFYPIDVKFPAKQQAQFTGLVEAANRAGFKLRVALIASRYDMGSVTSLYGKPRTYARFLGTEIAFVFKQRLLVVMSNGFGFNWPGNPTTSAYALLSRIPIGRGSLGLLAAARTAVQRLTSAAGLKVTAPTDAAGGRGGSHSSLVIVTAALAALLLAAAAVLVLRRRRR